MYAAACVVRSHRVQAVIYRRRVTGQNDRIAASDDLPNLFGHAIMKGEDY
jgi:hypothetical protein